MSLKTYWWTLIAFNLLWSRNTDLQILKTIKALSKPARKHLRLD